MVLKIMLNKTGECNFQEFDSGTMGMVNCGKVGKVKHSKGWLCHDHAAHALNARGKRVLSKEVLTDEGHIKTQELGTSPEYLAALDEAYELV